jgi:hypothetical protein
MKRKRHSDFMSSGWRPDFGASGRAVFLLGMSAFALPWNLLHGQVNPGGPSLFGSGPIGNTNYPTPQERARRKVLAAQRIRHQQEMASDVAKLLILAKDLNKEAQDDSSKQNGDAEKARQIEKLAHRVQTLMREAGVV